MTVPPAEDAIGLRPEYWRLYSTTRVEALQGGKVTAQGTGFFHALPTSSGEHRVLVTNCHVVRGAEEARFEVRVGFRHSTGAIAPGDRTVTVISKNPARDFVSHPTGLDLCAIPLEGALSSAMRKLPKEWMPLVVNSSTSHVASHELMLRMAVYEHVVMLGHPIGLMDSVARLPLLRRGITAYHPSLDWDGKPIGVVDIAAYPGSSGSPIWAVRETTRPGPQGPYSLHYEERLLGILYAGPTHSADGRLDVEEVPTAAACVPRVDVQVHLGFYVKATELQALGPVLQTLLGRQGAH